MSISEPDLASIADLHSTNRRMGTWEWDVASGRVTWSEQQEHIFGLEPGTFDGTPDTYIALVHPEDRDRLWSVVQDALENGRDSYHIVHRVTAGGAQPRWVECYARILIADSGAPTRVLGVTTDVTAHVHYERLHERQEDMLATVDVGRWYCDLPFEELIWDRKVKEHFWLPADARVTIDTFYQQIHPDDRERTRLAIDQSIAQGTPYDIEYRTCSPGSEQNGQRTRWVRAIGYTAYDARHNPIRFDGVTVDVTAQKRMESEAAEANRAKSQFLARMSHDLRTPLNAIGGYAQLLEMEVHGPVTVDQRTALGRIQRAQAHLLALINEILSFAKLEAGQVQVTREPVLLGDVLDTLAGFVRPDAERRGLALDIIAPTSDIAPFCDRERLMQVLLNLTSNAVKFTDHGTISVDVDADDTHVRIRVRDTGRGIARERLEHIFEPFVQEHAVITADVPHGVGLGLAISRELTRLMDGDITAESTPGEGSVFTVRLPRSP